MLNLITFDKPIIVPKGWGKEVQIVNLFAGGLPNFPTGYSGKLLVYDKAGAISSMHFHTKKHETFYVLSGYFLFAYYDPTTAERLTRTIDVGEVVSIPTNNPHQLSCLQSGTIIEFASSDFSWDNVRIGKGDSQHPKKLEKQ